MTPADLVEVIVTAPDPEWLADFVRQLVRDRLVAAGHVAEVRSLYEWRGVAQDHLEGRATLHTRLALVPTIAERTRASHPYALPAVAALPIIAGSPDYLRWITDQTEHH